MKTLTAALVLLGVIGGYRINYYDCEKPTRVTEIRADVLCDDRPTKTGDTEVFTILQKRKHTTFKGYRCKVVKSTWVLYCGAFSHDKVAAIPRIEISQDVRAEECDSMVTTSRYRSMEGGSHSVELGKETVFWVNERGQLHTEANKIWCQGQEMKLDGNVISGMMQLAQYRIVIEKAEYVVEGRRVESTLDHVRLPRSCKAKAGGCITASWVYVYEPPTDTCPLVKIRETRLQKENEFYIDHDLKLMFTVTDRAQSPSGCTPIKILYTNFESLYLAKSSDFKMVDEVDLTLYTNIRDDYMMHSTEGLVSQMGSKMDRGLCRNKYQSDSTEILVMDQGQFGRRNGDVIYVFTCMAKVGKIQTLENCGSRIPIEGNVYVDPRTRIVSDHWSQRDCNVHYPMMVKSLDGWVSINPDLRPAKESTDGRINDGNLSHEDMSKGGLYTRQEVESWESLIQYSQYRDAVSENLAYGVCVKEGKCTPRIKESVPQYNLRLIQDAIANPIDTIFDEIDSFIRRTGGYLSLIVIVMW